MAVLEAKVIIKLIVFAVCGLTFFKLSFVQFSLQDPCFKQISTIKLGDTCTAFGISHKYGIVCMAVDNQLKLIHTEELLKENINDLFTTKVQCHTLVCSEDILVVGHEDNIIIYSYPNLVQVRTWTISI